jgi:hypothetical protein
LPDGLHADAATWGNARADPAPGTRGCAGD